MLLVYDEKTGETLRFGHCTEAEALGPMAAGEVAVQVAAPPPGDHLTRRIRYPDGTISRVTKVENNTPKARLLNSTLHPSQGLAMFGKPVLVTRDTTERPEAIAAGTGRLVGTETATLKLRRNVIHERFAGEIADRLNLNDGLARLLTGELARAMLSLAMVGLFFLAMYFAGQQAGMGWAYSVGLIAAGAFALYQQWLILERKPDQCFKAFLNNNWVGVAIWAGLLITYAIN